MTILSKIFSKNNISSVYKEKVHKNPTIIYEGEEIELKDEDVENLRVYNANIGFAKEGDVKAQFLAGKALLTYVKAKSFALNRCEEAVKLLKNAAIGGIAETCRLVGDYYHNKYLGGADYVTALEWYRRGADLRDSDSYWALGNAYEFGEGVSENHCKAFEYYLQGVKLGEPYSMRQVGIAYYEGNIIEQDKEKAYYFLKGAYEKGKKGEKCGYYLSQYYFNGEIVEKNPEKGVEILEDICSDYNPNFDDGEAELLLYCYENGVGTPVNYEAAHQLRLKMKRVDKLFSEAFM